MNEVETLPNTTSQINLSEYFQRISKDPIISKVHADMVHHFAIFGEPLPNYEAILKRELKRFFDAQPFKR